MTLQTITMPQLGESVTEGTIDRWLVKVGDYVKKYDALAEVTTDKVTAEIPSSFEGEITALLIEEGETVAVASALCEINASEQEAPSVVTEQDYSSVTTPEEAPKTSASRYSPAVMRLAQQYNINLQDVTGTGLGGRITRKDIELYHATQSEAPKLAEAPVQAAPSDTAVAVSKVRKAIAKNMKNSVTEIPHAWMMIEVDVTDLVSYRDSIKGDFKAQEGFNLTYFAFFIKAVAQALKEYPALNSTWADDEIIHKKAINISIAVATDEALFVPVIKNADDKSVKGIAKTIDELATKVRQDELKLHDIQDGTFTVNNTGTFGSVQSMGIINHPQAAILQIEKIVKRPVVLENNAIAVRDMVNLCLSLDHRILDGLICGKFLNRVKEILENTNKATTSIY